MTKTTITYRRTVKTIPDKPLYRTIVEWALIGALVGASAVGIYYKQKEFNDSIKTRAYQTNTLERVVE
jgi:hypothetical protein